MKTTFSRKTVFQFAKVPKILFMQFVLTCKSIFSSSPPMEGNWQIFLPLKSKTILKIACITNIKFYQIDYCCQAVDFFFDIFLKDVPTKNCSFGQLSSYRHPSVVANIENIIRDGASLMTLDCANGKLIGICLSYTITR